MINVGQYCPAYLGERWGQSLVGGHPGAWAGSVYWVAQIHIPQYKTIQLRD